MFHRKIKATEFDDGMLLSSKKAKYRANAASEKRVSPLNQSGTYQPFVDCMTILCTKNNFPRNRFFTPVTPMLHRVHKGRTLHSYCNCFKLFFYINILTKTNRTVSRGGGGFSLLDST